MKQNNIKVLALVLTMSMLAVSACKDKYLEQLPAGVYNEKILLTKKGIDGLLINAYAGLDGNTAGAGGIGAAVGADNWIYGSILGGEAYKAGVNFTDQGPLNSVMQYDTPSSNPHIDAKWNSIYDGIARANLVLQTLPKITDPAITDADKKRLEAEARFIRAFQHFEGKKVFGNIPFIDEQVTDYKVPNTDAGGNYLNIWPRIEADLQFAYDNLDEITLNLGRVNKWAAAAFLAKAYLYQHKFTEAKNLFDLILLQGKNSRGVAYDLHPDFGDNFRIATQNGKESVFEVQMAVGDGSGTNGFQDAVLTYPNGIGGGTNSWFFRPSQNAVNTFRTDALGLPLPDTYNDVEVTSFEHIPDDQPFTPYAGNLDPRLDHTVGRRGIPFLDWGLMTGIAFTAPPGESITNGGPYSPKKWVFSKAENAAGLSARAGWYFTNAMNYAAMRFADVLLMAAECEAEVGSLDKAQDYVNRIRARAAASPVKKLDGTANAANYAVGPYRAPWTSQEAARKAIRFERRLELAEEGHRFFDLVRWGIAEQFVNTEYLPKESQRRTLLFSGGIKLTPNKSEYQPIPIYAITQSNKGGKPTLKQNPGY
jgi:hypothetical protein